MFGNRFDNTLELMKLLINSFQGLAIVDPCAFEQLVRLEREDTGGRQARRISGLEVDEFAVSQAGS